MLKVGDKLPAGKLQEFVEVEGNGCSLGPNSFDVEKATAGKKIAIFGLPGAFTPTCSAKHVPGYVENADALKAAGRRRDLVRVGQRRVRDGRLGPRPEDRRQGAHDGRRQRRFAKATGLTLDLTARGMGVRSNRYSMLVDDGVVKTLNVEAPGKFEVSDAETLLKQAQQLRGDWPELAGV